MNNILHMDWFASQGYWVFGLDYFLGDPAQNQQQPYDVEAWVAFAKARADPLVLVWNAAVRTLFPTGTKYVAVGYCFGAPYSMEAGATTEVVAAAFAQPALLTEGHFYNIAQPLFMSCAEIDMTFPTASRNRAMDILSEIEAVHHLQVFGGTEHGFATRADLTDPADVWAKETSANSILGWFDRFTA
ncbi:dienelactone hydrolase [Coprinopsis cinerea AmutBmut pab1-1]|nr:dienelactone hydrolase [Coprinopsis cinerea AmutBmut pab1-1]